MATPNPTSKAATSSKAKNSGSAKPSKAKPVADKEGDEATGESARKTRKRAADSLEGKDGEASGPSTRAKTDKPQKKVKTSAPHKVKASKDDGHPIEIVKSFPGGDMVEMEPDEVEHTKPSNTTKTKDKKATKGQNTSARKDDVTDATTATFKKSKGKKKEEKADEEPLEDIADTFDLTGVPAAGKSKSMATKKKDTSKAIDEPPLEILLAKEVDNAPEGSTNGPSNEHATTAKGKRGPKAKGAKKTVDPTEVATGPTEKAPKEDAAKAKSSKSKKRKALEDVDVAGSKTKAAGSHAEAGSSTKKQKKSKLTATETASGALHGLVESGKKATTQGLDATKDFSNNAAEVAQKSVMGDMTGIASEAVSTKKEKPKQAQTSKKGKGKSTNNGPDTTEEIFSSFDATGEELAGDGGHENNDSDEDDQTAALLKGFESDDDDEGEPSGEHGFETGQEIPGLPAKKGLSNKLKKVQNKGEESGVVYVGCVCTRHCFSLFYSLAQH